MDRLIITGGRSLEGETHVQGSKNALLPMLAAAVMRPGVYTFTNCPDISDAHAMAQIITLCGGSCSFDAGVMDVDTRYLNVSDVPVRQTRAMRSSIFLLGPMLSRFGKVSCSYPGGCAIGARPIDLHIKSFRALGADADDNAGRIVCSSGKAHCGSVRLDFPSVGATENIMMFAASLEGVTEIENAAREPEIADLQGFMRAQGIEVSGAGTSKIVVKGGIKQNPCRITYKVMPDRIAAGTLLCAAAATRGKITLRSAKYDDIVAITSKLSEMGCKIYRKCDTITIDAKCALCAPHITETMPYPGFPTDMQAQLLALCTTVYGTSVICERMYENRYRHVSELRRMGADIIVCGRTAVVRGGRLVGAVVKAQDLRGGAALVTAGLAAQGITTVENADSFIDRGYESIEKTLSLLGADIKRVKA